MTDVVATAASTDADGAGRPPSPRAPADGKRRRKRGGKLGIGGWLCLLWLVLVTVSAVLAPILPIDVPDDPDFLVPKNADIGTAGHLLGTDENGYDIFSRLIWGGRVSIVIGLGVLLVGMIIGGTIGLVAGFMRGRSESAADGGGRHLPRLPCAPLPDRDRGLPRQGPREHPDRHLPRVDPVLRPHLARDHAQLRATRVRDSRPRPPAPVASGSSCERSCPT